ncbi:hypothetical protein [Namhaeicola litoreus]|uniref:Chain length determinant protein n=1 Tax=Namhaeicola litoreus TaxID=1052145 RepID=A0ABW3Y206_9FLAO
MNSKEKNSPEDEVDLGNLFTSIGKGIKNFFRWISDVLEAIFHSFILFLLFLRKHWLKILGSALVGFLLGLGLDLTKAKTYVSDLILETNYGSGAQLYKVVDYLDELVQQNNSETLAQVLKISREDAQSITSIHAKVFEKSRNLRLEYERFLRTSDSIILKHTTYDDFINRLSEDNFRYHQIRVRSTSNSVFTKITKELTHLVATDYFENIRRIRMDELMSRKLILKDNLAQIDSLRNLYKKVALLNAQKGDEKATLTIDSKQLEEVNKDLPLFDLTDQISKQMAWLNDDIIEKASVVNIVSDFAEEGVIDRNLRQRYSVRLALIFSIGALFIILLNALNKYLNRYKTNRNI